MKLPAILMVEFADGKTNSEIVKTDEEFQLALSNAQNLSAASRILIFEHYETLSKQTVWANPPVTH